MAERTAPKPSPQADATAIRWLLNQHDAPCGDAHCDSVYCYIATRFRELVKLEKSLARNARVTIPTHTSPTEAEK